MTDTLTTTTVIAVDGAEALTFLAALRSVNVARCTDSYRPILTAVLVDGYSPDGTSKDGLHVRSWQAG
jgi:hypothetical protein